MVPLRVPWCKKPNLKLSQERVSSHWLGVIEVIVITMKCGWSGRSITWTNWLSIAFCRVIWDKRLSQLISSSHQTVRSCLTVIDNILSYPAHARSCTKLNNFCLFFWQGMNNFLFVTLFLTSLHLPGPTLPLPSPLTMTLTNRDLSDSTQWRYQHRPALVSCSNSPHLKCGNLWWR